MARLSTIILFFILTALPLPAEEGLASWYAGKFQGRMTANGEVFDTNRFTAAHKTLAFNTIARVTNIETGESTFVRINDRGPFVEGRIIDLSRAAAAAIGLVAAGIAPVEVEVVVPGDGTTYHRSGYRPVMKSIQVAAFADHANAISLAERLSAARFETLLETVASGVTRVIVAGVPVEDVPLAKIRLAAIGHTDVFVLGGGGR